RAWIAAGSAAAGVEMLSRIAETDITETANAQGRKLIAGLNDAFAQAGVAWAAYGNGSSVYVFTNPDSLDVDPHAFDPMALPMSVMSRAGGHPATALFRLALLVNGVDFNGKPGAIVSAVHTDTDIADTVAAAAAALDMLKAEKLF
ncbi:MAG: hypothetical protein VW405_18405, partial [Rhodospirillaceae bacterium]